MTDLGDLVDLLRLRVLHSPALLKLGMGEHVHVLVDRAGHKEAPMLAIIGGQIGATAAKRDAQRRTLKITLIDASPSSRE